MPEDHNQLLREWHQAHGKDGLFAREGRDFTITERGRRVLRQFEANAYGVIADAMYREEFERSDKASIWGVVRRLEPATEESVPGWLEGSRTGNVVQCGRIRGVVIKTGTQYDVWCESRSETGLPYWTIVSPTDYGKHWTHVDAAEGMEQKAQWRRRIFEFDGGTPHTEVAEAIGFSEAESAEFTGIPQHLRQKPVVPEDGTPVRLDVPSSVAKALYPGSK